MKVTTTCQRNNPSTISGYSITVTTIYSSFCKEEIDEIEKRLPNGVTVIDTDNPDRRVKVRE